MAAFVMIGTVNLPWPDRESGLQTSSTLVSGSRNAAGKFVGQRIGRDQSKIELVWTRLDAATWASVLQLFAANFVVAIKYYDMVTGNLITRNMYVSDRTARPGRVDSTGRWLTALDCKLNLIDTGG